jgi:methylmalonyl-CoA mutase
MGFVHANDYDEAIATPAEGSVCRAEKIQMLAISEHCRALRATDTTYQRGKIREENLNHERKKHDGPVPLCVNAFLPKDRGGDTATELELIRSVEAENGQQSDNVKYFRIARVSIAAHHLKPLQDTARERKKFPLRRWMR